jgi:hypothetical protein
VRRADRPDQGRGGIDMVGVDLGGLDRDAGALLDRFGDRVAFELAAAGVMSGKMSGFIAILCTATEPTPPAPITRTLLM